MRIKNPLPIEDNLSKPRWYAKKLYYANHLDIICKLYLINRKDDLRYELNINEMTKDLRSIVMFNRTWHIPWDRYDELELSVELSYEGKSFDAGLPHKFFSGKQSFSAWWRMRHGENDITIDRQTIINNHVPSGSGSWRLNVEKEQGESPPNGQYGFIWLKLMTHWTYSDEGLNVSVDVPKLPISIDGNVLSSQKEYQRDYLIRIDLMSIKPKPKPKPLPPPVMPPEELMSWTLYFKHNVRADDPEGLRALDREWINPLLQKHPRLLKGIISGAVPLRIRGFASSTAPKDVDERVSHERILSTERHIRMKLAQHLLSINRKADPKRDLKAIILREPKGHRDAVLKGPSATEQRVEILIDREAAYAALNKQ